MSHRAKFIAPVSWDLPDGIWADVVGRLGGSWASVAKHTNRELRAEVEKAGAAGSLKSSDLCSSPELLKWAITQQCPWTLKACVTAAAGLGNVEVLQMCKDLAGMDHWIEDSEDVCKAAARQGNLSALKWARQHGCPWDLRTCAVAGRAGHLDVLQWARENGCPWGISTPAMAARWGHLAVLQWAVRNGCPIGLAVCTDTQSSSVGNVVAGGDKSYICTSAALGGHLTALQWAREQGCPWDTTTCAMAAAGGHLDMLKWLRQEGCPWDKQTCKYATTQGHPELLQWAIDHGCPPWQSNTLHAS